jgi:hypothetical protein
VGNQKFGICCIYPCLAAGLLDLSVHLVYVLLVVLLQLVPLELEAGGHEAVVDLPLLWVQVHHLDPLKTSQVALLSTLVQFVTDGLGSLHVTNNNLYRSYFSWQARSIAKGGSRRKSLKSFSRCEFDLTV